MWVKISQVVAFSGLGEAQNISLATEKGFLRQIKKECNIYTDHQRNIFWQQVRGLILYDVDVSEV